MTRAALLTCSLGYVMAFTLALLEQNGAAAIVMCALATLANVLRCQVREEDDRW